MAPKGTLAVYWASGCGGCEVAVANLHERLLDLIGLMDLVFCPCLVDTKIRDVEAMPDGHIDVTLFNGAIRTDENAHMAQLMRRKSKILIAYGACSVSGGIPALANLHSRADHLATVYQTSPSTANPASTLPGERTMVPEGALQLPAFHERVGRLADGVRVDYFMPGCPPESDQLWNAVSALLSGPAPAPGAIVGAGTSSVCDQCARTRTGAPLDGFKRVYDVQADGTTCLLEQGMLCMGLATRDGCGALCPQVNMPCNGCYGAPDGVLDQGAKMVAALGSRLDIAPLKGLSEEAIERHVDRRLAAMPDGAGPFYKFTLASSLLGGRQPAGTEVR